MPSTPSETTDNEMLKIRVYVDDYCLGCKRAEELISELLVMYPNLNVSTINIAQTQRVPDSLFALPTWYVNAQVWMLGNPSWTELLDLIHDHKRM
jgi:hypothetical protein